MCAIPQSNWLNTIAVRTSYVLPILKRFPWWKLRKTRGVVYLPPEKSKQRPVCLLKFWGRPFKLKSKVSLKSVRWHVARLPGALVDTLLTQLTSFGSSSGATRKVLVTSLRWWQSLTIVIISHLTSESCWVTWNRSRILMYLRVLNSFQNAFLHKTL